MTHKLGERKKSSFKGKGDHLEFYRHRDGSLL
jgi:hypothetical protein